MTDSTMQLSAVYIAVVTMMAFLYIKVRRLEHQLKMQEAVVDMLMSETAPSEFLPELEQRIDQCEARCARPPSPPSPPQRSASSPATATAPPSTDHVTHDHIGSLLTSLVSAGSAVVYDTVADDDDARTLEEIDETDDESGSPAPSDSPDDHGPTAAATAATATPAAATAAAAKGTEIPVDEVSGSDDEAAP